MLRGGEREEELFRARRRGRSWLILLVAGFTRDKSEPGSPTHSTFILHHLLNFLCVCGLGRWRAPALEDTAAHPSPHCRIGSWITQLRRRAPLRKRVMGYGRTAAASRMYTWGLVWIFTAKTNKTLWSTDFYFLRRNFYKSAGIIHISPRDSYFFPSYARFELQSWAGWSHPAASRWSWSCCVVHHSQMVRNHSRWCRSVILTRCRVFVHERTNFNNMAQFGLMNGWTQRMLSLRIFG